MRTSGTHGHDSMSSGPLPTLSLQQPTPPATRHSGRLPTSWRGPARGREDKGVPWVAVRHADEHIHIVAILARVNGRPARLLNDCYRIGEAMACAEREHGLTSIASLPFE
jgi:hypothetical protein